MTVDDDLAVLDPYDLDLLDPFEGRAAASDHVGAVLYIDGKRFADTAAAWAAGDPVALADLDLTWGRETTVDQPDVSTLACRLVDRQGGTTLTSKVEIGMPLRLWAMGRIAPTDAGGYNTIIDGGFEAIPLGDPGERVYEWDLGTTGTNPQASVVPGSPNGIGAQMIHFDGAPDDVLLIPPSAFDVGFADAWLDLPQYQQGQQWSLTIAAARIGKGMQVQLRGRTFAGPGQHQGQKYAGSGTTYTGDFTFRLMTTTATGTAQDVNPPVWLGIAVRIVSKQSWTATAGTWAAQPAGDTWNTYTGVDLDRAGIYAPADAATRNVLAFAGRITDLAIEYQSDGSLACDVTAADVTADVANIFIGDEPWPAEGALNRVNRIYNAAGITGVIQMVADPGLETHNLSWRDVDNASTDGLLREIAAGLDFVMWGASAATLKPYVWFENPALRAQVATLEMGAIYVEVTVATPGNRPTGRTTLDACEVLREPIRWVRDVTDVITRVDASWLEQTLDEQGNPAPTEHSEAVIDTVARGKHGDRRAGVATQTTSAAEATGIANGILARTRLLQWRTTGLAYDLGLFPPPNGTKTANALDLLDGTRRIGRGLVVDGITGWPGGAVVGAYLDGGHYTYDGDWLLELTTTPMSGFGPSVAWAQLDAAWRWNQMEPHMTWADTYGVGGPALARGTITIGAN